MRIGVYNYAEQTENRHTKSKDLAGVHRCKSSPKKSVLNLWLKNDSVSVVCALSFSLLCFSMGTLVAGKRVKTSGGSENHPEPPSPFQMHDCKCCIV